MATSTSNLPHDSGCADPRLHSSMQRQSILEGGQHTKDQSPYKHERTHEIKNLEADLEARALQRSRLEEKINRLRKSTMSIIGQDDTSSTLATLHKSPSSASDDSGSSVSSEHKQFPASLPRLITHDNRGLPDNFSEVSLCRREKENNISQYLTRNRSCIADEVKLRKYQIGNLVSVMEEKETQLIQLKSQVSELQQNLETEREQNKKNVSNQANYKDRLAEALYETEQMKQKVEVQEEQIDYYEFRNQEKEHDIDSLQDQLNEALRRIVELELDLELHDIKFKSYESCRRQLGEYALDMMFEKTSAADHLGDSPLETSSGEKVYRQKLRSDLEDMEKRYVEEKRLGSIKIMELEKENKDMHKKILALERRIEYINDYGYELCKENSEKDSARGDDGTVATDSTTASSQQLQPFRRREAQPSRMTSYLRKRLETLEVQNTLYINKIKELKQQVSNITRSAEATTTYDRNENASLCIENDALRAKIVSLEPPLIFATKSSHGHQLQTTTTTADYKRYYHLQKKLDEKVSEILSLEDQLNAKDRIIAALRSQTVDKRLATRLSTATNSTTPTTTASSSCNSSFFSDTQNRALLSSSSSPNVVNVKVPSKIRPRCMDDDHVSGTTADETAESSLVLSDLQAQLQDKQKKLTARDEELRQIRVSSAAQVAELRAQIDGMMSKQKTRWPVEDDLYFL